MYRSFTSLVKIFPKYLILSDAIINRIVFLFPFVGCSLSVYRDATDFWVLILYLASLLNLMINFDL